MVDVELGVGQQATHDAGVDQRHDGVVVAGQQQRRLPDPGQQGQAGPAGPGGELVEVAAPGTDAGVAVQQGPRPARVGPDGPPVQLGADPLGVAGVQVAAGGGHPRQHPRPAGHHQRAGAGGNQHQPPATLRLAEGELLGQAAAPGDPQHVHPLVAQPVQEPGDQAGQSRQAVGDPRQGRAAHAGDVEADHLDRAVESVDERLQQLQAGPDAAGEHQRGAGAVAGTDGHAQLLAADGHGPQGPFHRAPHRSST